MNQDKQPEALRLADAIDPFARASAPDHLTMTVAAGELRRQHARIAELEAELAAVKAQDVQGVQQIKANCYSDDDGDSWCDSPYECDFPKGLKVGETFELQASIRSWSETFRVTKAPDETSDDYEVELVSSDAPTFFAPQAQDVQDAKRMDWVDNHGRVHIDWALAPLWARYAAMDDDGSWFWHEYEPKPRHDMWWMADTGWSDQIPVDLDWKTTLTERPA